MIVEDEFEEDEFAESVVDDSFNPPAGSVYERPVNVEGLVIQHEPFFRATNTLATFWTISSNYGPHMYTRHYKRT